MPAAVKFVWFRMRCGKVIRVIDTPQARENARRMQWVEVAEPKRSN